MPLFGRRSGSAQPPVDRSTQASAAVAASQAFLQSSSSQGALSSAAAAAALRSYTPTPEPVGNIQTKRMVRRGSNSSAGSASRPGSAGRGAPARGGLQRTNSGGSMTERTFRSPSPSSRQAADASPVAAAPDAPPVPALPTGPRQKRSASLDIPTRVMSPTPARGGRYSSVDRSSMPAQTDAKVKRLAGLPELQREDSRNSVNFSRPIPTSPLASPAGVGKGGWFTGPTGTAMSDTTASKPASTKSPPSKGLSAVDAGFVKQDIRSAADKPVPTKRHSAAPGSHFARARAQEPAPDYVMVFDPNTRTFISKARDKDEEVTPDSPENPDAGYWDPHTRTFVRPEPSIDADVQPPPRNPARLSPNQSASPSPAAARPAGSLHKQPSIVREDYEGEREAETGIPPVRPKASSRLIPSTPQPPKSYVVPANREAHQRSSSLDIPRLSTEPGVRGRQTSLSPRRAAHFSDSPVIEAQKHQPPARSVSPIKSALKHSPSQRGYSPLASAKSPGSDAGASDTTSISDGQPGAKKKKSARVSFDENLQTAPPPATAAHHHVGIGRELSPAIDDDMEEVMKPRPALPSFGSVRKNRMPEMPEKVTEQPPDRHAGVSTDVVIGALLANEHARGEPAPPEVTSKEGDGYISDSSDSIVQSPQDDAPSAKNEDESLAAGAAAASQWLDNVKESSPEVTAADKEDVPTIKFQPPSPGIDEAAPPAAIDEKVAPVEPVAQPVPVVQPVPVAEPKTRENYFAIPGSWGGEEEERTSEMAPRPRLAATAPETSADEKSAYETSADIKPAPESNNLMDQTKASLGAVDTSVGLPQLSDIDESDDSAEFSDAAEDLSDLEGEGYASINAIVSSPIEPSPRAIDPAASPPDSPTVAVKDGKVVKNGDWSEATAYWSKLSKQQRDQIERDAMSSDDERPVKAPVVKTAKTKPASKQTHIETTDGEPRKQAERSRALNALSGSQPQPAPAMRKTMRAPPAQPEPVQDGAVHMRSSMRTSAQGGMKSSMRDSQRRQRPQSEQFQPRGATQSQHARTASGSQVKRAGLQRQFSEDSDAPSPQRSTMPRLEPKRNPPPAQLRAVKPPPVPNDSDSESSFRKKRRASLSTVDSQGRYTMRRSMRGGPPDARAPPAPAEQRPTSPTSERKGKGSFLRSLSPTGSFLGRKKGENLRESIRSGSVDTGMRTTMRNRPATSDGGKKSGLTSSGAGAARPTNARGAAAKLNSRFADSDDDDESPSRGAFRSRFADSDDEEAMSPALAPVRGIPRRKGQEDGDSTDLSDEDEGTKRTSRKRDKMSTPLVPSQTEIDRAMEAARKKLGMTNGTATAKESKTQSTEGTALTKGSLRSKPGQQDDAEPKDRSDETPAASPASTKRKGFMGSILRRNRGSSSASIPRVGTVTESPVPPVPPVPPGLSVPTDPTETPASPEGGGSSIQQTPTSPSSPSAHKLARRRPNRGGSNFSTATAPAAPMMHQNDSGNWPLPAIGASTAVASDDGIRPSTSGPSAEAIKLARTMRPEAVGRRSSQRVSIVDPADERDSRAVYSSRTGKKKKFGMLRRAFGLND